MVAVLNLMDDGYPSRTSYGQLYKMYQSHVSAKLDARSFCDALFHSIGMHESDYKFGKTKVFFRPGKFAEFDRVLQADQEGVVALANKTSEWVVRARWRQAQYAVLACIKLMRKIQYRGRSRSLIQKNVRGYLTRKKHQPKFEAMRTLHTLKTRLDTMRLSVDRLKGDKQKIVDEIDDLSKRIDKETAKIKGSATSPALMDAACSDFSRRLEQLLNMVQDVERKQKQDESALALQRMQEEMEREKRARQEEEEQAKKLEQERKLKMELEAKRRREEERQRQAEAERQLKEQEEAARKLQAELDQEEQARRMAMVEQERRDRELALRLAQEDGSAQDVDLNNPQAVLRPQRPEDHPDGRLSRRSLRRSVVVSAKQEERAAQKHDLSGWKYAELRDTINASCDIELLEACREEFHRRLKVYHEWKMKNKRRTQGQQDDDEQQRVPESVMQAARSASGGSSARAVSDDIDGGEAPQRYFRVPFVRPAGQPRDQPKGWWYAHFDGQWIARQIDMLPGKKPILLVAGKDDMEMCELSLEETGLTRKKGAEILPRQFEDLWFRHNGPSYERPTSRKK
jgi:myosin-6